MPISRTSTRKQITQWLRQKVESGEFKGGDRIPSTLQLASEWSTQEPTIQRALVPLVKEGYLVRTPRLGTFVCPRKGQFQSIGIYAMSGAWRAETGAFIRALVYEMQKQIAKAGMTERLFLDARPDSKQTGTWDALLDVAATSHLDALLVPTCDSPHMRWLDKLPIPVVYFATERRPNSIRSDLGNLARSALDLLAQQGARRVGLVCSHSLDSKTDGTESEIQIFYRVWMEYARQLGLEDLEENRLIFSSQTHDRRSPYGIVQFGYDSMLKLLKKANRPDGVFVYTDFAAHGAIVACNYGTNFSKDVKLVLHRNSKVGLFCPRPAAFVELKTEKVAAAMIEQARRMRMGEPLAEPYVAYSKIPAPRSSNHAA